MVEIFVFQHLCLDCRHRGCLKELTEADRTPLHAVAFLSTDNGHQELICQYLAGYSVITEMLLQGGIMSALLILLMVYHVFDLRYMPRHAIALTTLHNIVIGESSTTPAVCIFHEEGMHCRS
jgi:hypothetical protein